MARWRGDGARSCSKRWGISTEGWPAGAWPSSRGPVPASSGGSEAPDPALSNVVAALALALTDRISEATERAAGRGGQAPAALVALHEFLDGGTIEHLRQALGLSHSAAVRLVDRLVADGHVVRRDGPG